MKKLRMMSILSILLIITLFTCSCSMFTNAIESTREQLQQIADQVTDQNSGNTIPYGNYIPTSSISVTYNGNAYILLEKSNGTVIKKIDQNNPDDQEIIYETTDRDQRLSRLTAWDNKLYFYMDNGSHGEGVRIIAVDLDSKESHTVIQDNDLDNYKIYDGMIYGDMGYYYGTTVKTWDMEGNPLEEYFIEDFDGMPIPYKDEFVYICGLPILESGVGDNSNQAKVWAMKLEGASSSSTRVANLGEILNYSYLYYQDELYIYVLDDSGMNFYKFKDFQENGLEQENELFNGFTIDQNSAYSSILSNNQTIATVSYSLKDKENSIYTCSVSKFDQDQGVMIALYNFDFERPFLDLYGDGSGFIPCITNNAVLMITEDGTDCYQISLDPGQEAVQFDL